jgi:methionyl-tRNA synthetase
MTKFYITTPIYYINDIPHIGHAYTTVAADILARFYKQKLGEENVFFLTGTDEHGAKIAQAAKEKNQNPKEYADSIVPKFEDAWKLLNVNYSHFFRTTDVRHEKLVQEILQKIYDKGLIEEGIYEGLYCIGCEKFLTETDLIDGKCPLHTNKTPVHQKEKNYFFKLSKFKDELIADFERDTVKILPISKKKEILGKLKDELKDIAISREEVAWGIPIPWDKKQTIYVWVEALFNYYTATKFLSEKEKFWPPDLHLIGKDILWFHTVIWCALLKAAELPLPKAVFAHGFFSINSQKISKSLGNVISPKELVDKFGVDATRYLLVSQFPFGEDGDYSFDKLTESYNVNFANGLGNLVARVAKLCEVARFTQSSTEKSGHIILEQKEFDIALSEYRFQDALAIVANKITNTDKYINETKPWELLKQPEGDRKLEVIEDVLDHAVQQIQEIAILLTPFIPETAEKIKQQFEAREITASKPLFPRI